MVDVTVVTPCAPHHTQYLDACRASVDAQTISCRHLVSIDNAGDGAGAVRNRLLAQVNTEYVVFLDADDTIEPSFVEKTMARIAPFNYVYTDWYEDDAIKSTPEGGWQHGIAHVVTTLLHTHMARLVGGFDADLPGYEDTDFYLKLVTQHYCGVRVPESLFRYRANGGRSRAIHENGEVKRLQKLMVERYGTKIMSCCGNGDNPVSTVPVGQKVNGDVMAVNLRTNTERVQGYASGRFYGRIRPASVVWIDPRDAKAQPQFWRIVPDKPKPQPVEAPKADEPLTGAAALAEWFHQNDIFERALPEMEAAPDVEIKPDFDTIAKLVGKLYSNE